LAKSTIPVERPPSGSAGRESDPGALPARLASRTHTRLLGESPAFLRVMDAVSAIAPLDKPVLVVGERGTGKELVAERLHYLSSRWEGVFAKLNCAAISETLLESELFGHEAGAFTGASKLHRGRFERADGGTLFLDELATTSSLVQEKILRVIEYGEFERLGGSRTLATNIRLVAATNEDLPELARTGRFREDLLDRLAFDVITLPPLRARAEDIPLLAEAFAVRMTTELGREVFAGFSAGALEALGAYPWPGNVRELKNVIERSVYRHADPDAPLTEIVFDPFASPWRPGARSTPSAPPGAAQPASTAGSSAPSLPMDFREEVRQFEIRLLEQALEASQFNQKKTAEALGLTYHQLRGYLRKYELTGSGD
jgi:psp operon transcriptional activator